MFFLPGLALVVLQILFMTIPTEALNTKILISMSNMTTTKADTYSCTSYKLNKHQNFIVGFEINTTSDIVHHIQVFACQRPAFALKHMLDCYEYCHGEKEQLIFAWVLTRHRFNCPMVSLYKFSIYLFC